MIKKNESPALTLAKLCRGALDEKKAEDIRLLDVASVSSITDYLVVATATSEPHLRALRVELEKVVDANRTRIVGVETAAESGWIVMDLFDVMVHLFTPERREQFGLERLWKDAADVSKPAKVAKAPKRKAKAKAAAPKGKKSAPIRKAPAAKKRPTKR